MIVVPSRGGRAAVLAVACALLPAASYAAASPQGATAPRQTTTPPRPSGAATPAQAATAVPTGYIIGADDILSIVVWREKDLSADVVVRPDGRITLPLVNDLEAQGLTPDQLRERITAAMSRYVADPNVTVVVKQINSRKVYITGQVAKPGAYPLSGPTTVLQLISMAGGLNEFAKTEDIVITRTENGKPVALRFNYKDVLKGRRLQQNIQLRPGDTVLVP